MAGLNAPKLIVINSGGTLVNEVIYAKPCIVHQVHVAHDGGSATFIQIHDVNSAPANGTVPMMVHTVGANSDADIEPHSPLYFENGVYVCESSTLPTKTLAGLSHLFVYIIIEEQTYDA